MGLCLFLPHFRSQHRWMLKMGGTSETYVCGCGMLASGTAVYFSVLGRKRVRCSAHSIEGDHTTENLFRFNFFPNDFLKLLDL